MTVLPIVTDLAALRVVSQPVTVFDADLRALAADMVETMRAHNGIGLAAVQVGRPIRLIVYEMTNGGWNAICNPVIAQTAGYITGNEGCLSLPETVATVRRAKYVQVRYHAIDGMRRSWNFPPPVSVVIQHELDHLDGRLITDYAPEAAR